MSDWFHNAESVHDIQVGPSDYGVVGQAKASNGDHFQIEIPSPTTKRLSGMQEQVQAQAYVAINGRTELMVKVSVSESSSGDLSNVDIRAEDGGGESFYVLSLGVRTTHLWIEGATRAGGGFTFQYEEGEELPEQLFDVDAAMPSDLREQLAPAMPLVAAASVEAIATARSRRGWWKWIGRVGCPTLASLVDVIVCAGAPGVGCILATTLGQAAAAVCVDKLHA